MPNDDEKLDIEDDEVVADEIGFALDVDPDDLYVTDNNDFRNVTAKNVSLGRRTEFLVFASEEDAVEAAEEYVYDQLTSEPENFDQDWLREFVNEKQLHRVVEEMLREDEYVEDMAQSDTEDFWKLADSYGHDVPEEDEDGDVRDPTDDEVEAVKDEWVKRRMKDPMETLTEIIPDDEDLAKWLEANVGIETSKAAEAAVSQDGWETFLSRIDGNSYTTAGGFVYVQTQGNPIGRNAPKKIEKFMEPL